PEGRLTRVLAGWPSLSRWPSFSLPSEKRSSSRNYSTWSAQAAGEGVNVLRTREAKAMSRRLFSIGSFLAALLPVMHPRPGSLPRVHVAVALAPRGHTNGRRFAQEQRGLAAQANLDDVGPVQQRKAPVDHDPQPPAPTRHLQQVIRAAHEPGQEAAHPYFEEL